MGYQTVMRVPRIRTYTEALRLFNQTTPIRGRDPEIRPLGERRHADTYSIRKNIWNENIELVLYQTPVIKWTPEDEVLISFGRWSSASTCQFIGRVLGLTSNRVRGDVVLHFIGGKASVIRDHEELVLVKGEHNHWQPKISKKEFDYRVDRKGANNVRKRVGQFRNYLDGMLKLKTDSITLNQGTQWEHVNETLSFTYRELGDALGWLTHGAQQDRYALNVAQFEFIHKPAKWQSTHAQPWEKYDIQSKLFYELVRDDQDDNTRHQNYWIALCALVARDVRTWWIPEDDKDSRIARTSPNIVSRSLEKFIMGYFSDEVFKKVELDDGGVPSGKYDDYVRKGVEA